MKPAPLTECTAQKTISPVYGERLGPGTDRISLAFLLLLIIFPSYDFPLFLYPRLHCLHSLIRFLSASAFLYISLALLFSFYILSLFPSFCLSVCQCITSLTLIKIPVFFKTVNIAVNICTR
jgi:hypothetical protein